jgi:hypothetical protein
MEGHEAAETEIGPHAWSHRAQPNKTLELTILLTDILPPDIHWPHTVTQGDAANAQWHLFSLFHIFSDRAVAMKNSPLIAEAPRLAVTGVS